MKFKFASSVIASAVLLVSLFTVAPAADASIITIQYTGTVGSPVGSVFGQSGSAMPVSISFVYDTSLGSQLTHLAAGSPAAPQYGGATLGEDFYGWSAAGVVSTNVTFGTKTWTADDLTNLNVNGSASIPAQVWFNADPTLVAPTAVLANFTDADGRFGLGGLFLGSTITFSTNASVTQTGNFPASGSGAFNITRSADPVSTVPEPTSILLLGTGLLGLAARVRRR